MRIISILSVFFLLAVSYAYGQQLVLKDLKRIEPVAKESLATLSGLITKENFKQMGFESPEEVRTATIGAPLQEFIVRLDNLQKYQSGGNVIELLTPVNHVTYPVLVGGEVRSSFTMADVNGKWRAVSFGSPNLVRLLSKHRKESSKVTGLSDSSYFIVQVPSFNVYFLAYSDRDGKLMLIPLLDDNRFKFKAGAVMPAEEVFSSMAPVAREHDGLPR